MSAAQRTFAGYRNRLTAKAGDCIDFMVSSFDGQPFEADLVRIISGNTRAPYAGLELEEVAAPFAGNHEGVRQRSHMGSHATVELSKWQPGSFSLTCAVQPTTRERGDTTLFVLMAESGPRFELGITSEGQLFAELVSDKGQKSQSVELAVTCPLRRWSFVGLAYDAAKGRVRIFQRPQDEGPGDGAGRFAATAEADINLGEVRFTHMAIAARPENTEPAAYTKNHFNGRMDSPRLVFDTLNDEALINLIRAGTPEGVPGDVFGFWDFAAGMGGRTFGDQGRLSGACVFHNLPTRAVKGIRWTGDVRDWRAAPDQYSAVHFHEDDVYDIGWAPSFSYTVPADLRSGVYAARIKKGDETDYVIFFVSPEKPTAKIAFLASTATYLSYANERVGVTFDAILAGKVAPLPEEQMMLDHPEFGLSHYDHHLDGSGVHFSSYLRPTINWRPDTRIWAFNADTDIIRWLERSGETYDVITDEALHEDGAKLLAEYDVVITGTHPEYYSTAMLDGVEDYLGQGGRLMYMGGNGFYWRVAHSEAWPGAIELRRAEDGTRAWMSRSGEYHQQFDGAVGGLWRRQDRPPQKLVGIGFAAQGGHKGLRFRRSAGADDPRAAFAMEGVRGDILADFSKMSATPNAEELDRVDFDLGAPAHTLVLAASENAPPDMMRTKEELLIALPQIPDEDIRADVTFFETNSGGAVFSTGSIGWSSILAYKDYQNSAAILTTNVLKRFADPAPFEVPAEPIEPSIAALTPQVYQSPPGMRTDMFSKMGMMKQAFAKAVMTMGLSALIKLRGLPKLLPRDRIDR